MPQLVSRNEWIQVLALTRPKASVTKLLPCMELDHLKGLIWAVMPRNSFQAHLRTLSSQRLARDLPSSWVKRQALVLSLVTKLTLDRVHTPQWRSTKWARLTLWDPRPRSVWLWLSNLRQVLIQRLLHSTTLRPVPVHMNREQYTRTSIQDHGSELRQDRVWLARKQDLYLALTSTAKIQSQLYSGLPLRMALELLAGRRAPKSRSRDLVPELMKQRVLSLVKTKVRHLEENSVSRQEISILVPDSTRQCSPRQSRLSLGGESDLLCAVKRRGQSVSETILRPTTTAQTTRCRRISWHHGASVPRKDNKWEEEIRTLVQIITTSKKGIMDLLSAWVSSWIISRWSAHKLRRLQLTLAPPTTILTISQLRNSCRPSLWKVGTRMLESQRFQAPVLMNQSALPTRNQHLLMDLVVPSSALSFKQLSLLAQESTRSQPR